MLIFKKKLPDPEKVASALHGALAYIEEVFPKPKPTPVQIESDQDNGLHYCLRTQDDYKPAVVDKVLHEQLSKHDSDALRRTLEDNADLTFTEKLMVLIRDRGMTDPQVYRAAFIDRRLFSRVMSDRKYSPSRDTAVAIAMGLHLTSEEAADLLKRAGFTFSHSYKRDIVIEHFFREGIHDIPTLNAVLEKLGERQLGQ